MLQSLLSLKQVNWNNKWLSQNVQYLILGLMDLTLNPWAPKLNIAHFVRQDFCSQILRDKFNLIFFFLLFTPWQERDFTIIVKVNKVSSLALYILLFSLMKLGVLVDETGRRNKKR